MTREKLQGIINDLSDNSPLNYLSNEQGDSEKIDYARYNPQPSDTSENRGDNIAPELLGMRFYERPIYSIARADAPGFAEIRRPEVVGPYHLLPQDLLPEAKSVISLALPVSRSIVEANKIDPVKPSLEWLYSRIEGNKFLLELGAAVRDALIQDGHKAVTPYLDDRFQSRFGGEAAPGTESFKPFSSNWSERHIGVASGLGTFGLSTNFISRVGSTVRLISVVTDWDTEPDERDYEDWLGYCNRCGACIRKCPVQAHFKDKQGKDHKICSAFIRKISEEHLPRYGCGKCQTGTPCEYQPRKMT